MTGSARIAGVVLAIAAAAPAEPQPVCSDTARERHGQFVLLWHDRGSGCLTLGAHGTYAVTWRLGSGGNLVAGTGWRIGTTDRVVAYTPVAFRPGSNGYLSLYGWSRSPLAEYYVVEAHGSFIPPGPGAQALGTMNSDGAIYRLYRTRRIDAPSIAGIATFDQYWSVRTTAPEIGRPTRITFARHVQAWRAAGMPLGTLDYQIVATEGFGSDGRSRVQLGRSRLRGTRARQ